MIWVQPRTERAIKPTRRAGDAGLDIFSPTKEIIPAGQTLKWGTGLMIAPPEGWHLLALQKSRHQGQLEVHAPLIDGSYRGEVHFCIRNLNDTDWLVARGDAMMQLMPVMSPDIEIMWDLAEQLPITERGEGGFGSTLET